MINLKRTITYKRYENYKKFCKQIDDGEWVVDKHDMSSYAINGKGKVYTITRFNHGKEQLWISNGFMCFSDYNYDRPQDHMTINVFGLFKLAAWIKATPLIFKARRWNLEFTRLKIKGIAEEKRSRILYKISNK